MVKQAMKVLNFIVLILLFALLVCCKKNCSQFKTGTFRIKATNETLDNYSIRTDSSEIIYNDSIGFRDEFKIVWTGECEYYMVFQKTNRPDIMQLTSFDTAFIQILNTNTHGFKFKGKVNEREYFAEQEEFHH